VHQQRLGSRYLVVNRLGGGGMGEVFLARMIGEPGDQLAVKILRPELADDPDLVSRFLQESRLLRGVQHPNVVRVLDLVAEGDRFGIVMEYVPDGDLRRAVAIPCPTPLALDLLAQVADGLAAIHGAGITHRDLKPENVLVKVRPDGTLQPRVTDFGVSHRSDSLSMRHDGIVGTAGYLSPESACGLRAGPEGDVYALGVMLYELCTGQRPFVADNPLAVIRAHAESPIPRPPAMPGPIWDLLSAMLAKDPAQRPSAVETGSRLRALMGAGGVSSVPAARGAVAAVPQAPEVPVTGPVQLGQVAPGAHHPQAASTAGVGEAVMARTAARGAARNAGSTGRAAGVPGRVLAGSATTRVRATRARGSAGQLRPERAAAGAAPTDQGFGGATRSGALPDDRPVRDGRSPTSVAEVAAAAAAAAQAANVRAATAQLGSAGLGSAGLGSAEAATAAPDADAADVVSRDVPPPTLSRREARAGDGRRRAAPTVWWHERRFLIPAVVGALLVALLVAGLALMLGSGRGNQRPAPTTPSTTPSPAPASPTAAVAGGPTPGFPVPAIPTLALYQPTADSAEDSDGQARLEIGSVDPGAGTLSSIMVLYDDGGTRQIGPINGVTGPYRTTITGLQNGRVYTFTVRVCNSSAECSTSRALTFTPYTVPTLDLLTVTASQSSATIGWPALPLNGNPRSWTCRLTAGSSPHDPQAPNQKPIAIGGGSVTWHPVPLVPYTAQETCTDGVRTVNSPLLVFRTQ
jgi:serine/threonine-protein kinase